MAGKPILVVRVPETDPIELELLRDAIVESFTQCAKLRVPPVLVLPEGARVEWLHGPGRCAVEVRSAELITDNTPPAVSETAAEKNKVLRRMKEFREKHGPGCWTALANASRSKSVTETLLRNIYYESTPVSLDTWRKINAALDKLEGGEN